MTPERAADLSDRLHEANLTGLARAVERAFPGAMPYAFPVSAYMPHGDEEDPDSYAERLASHLLALLWTAHHYDADLYDAALNLVLDEAQQNAVVS